MAEKKRRGILKSSASGIFRVGKAAGKTTAKVAGKTTKVVGKGGYKSGKVAAKGGYKAGKVAAKGGYITMKSGGRTFLFAARKAYPRHDDETNWQYRKRMAKLGFKVSLFSGKIILAANNSANVQQFALRLAGEAALDKTQDLAINRLKRSKKKDKPSQKTR